MDRIRAESDYTIGSGNLVQFLGFGSLSDAALIGAARFGRASAGCFVYLDLSAFVQVAIGGVVAIDRADGSV